MDKGYARVARCTGHSATVRGVDWSLDSSIIMSHSADLELLYWNARTGKQVDPLKQGCVRVLCPCARQDVRMVRSSGGSRTIAITFPLAVCPVCLA